MYIWAWFFRYFKRWIALSRNIVCVDMWWWFAIVVVLQNIFKLFETLAIKIQSIFLHCELGYVFGTASMYRKLQKWRGLTSTASLKRGGASSSGETHWKSPEPACKMPSTWDCHMCRQRGEHLWDTDALTPASATNSLGWHEKAQMRTASLSPVPPNWWAQ